MFHFVLLKKMLYRSKNSFVQSQQWKFQKINLFKFIMTPEPRHLRRSNVSVVSFEQISHSILLFSLLTLDK